MKGLKSKLMAATAMLTVSAVMLVSTSFAWYTLSTNPEVKDIKATAVANQNLEIALVKSDTQDATNVDTLSEQNSGVQGSKTSDFFTWGNSVKYTIGENEMLELRPTTYVAANGKVKFAGTDNTVSKDGLYIPTYGDDGRISGMETDPLTDTTMADNKSYTTVGKKDGTQYAVRYDIWMRTNTAGVITLATAGAKLADGSGIDDTGAGSYISTTAYQTNSETNKYPAGAIKVVFHIKGGDVDTWVSAKNADAISDNKVTLSADDTKGLFTAAANVTYKVQMYVYLDGQVVTNAMANTAISDLAVNVQFDNKSIDESGAMTK